MTVQVRPSGQQFIVVLVAVLATGLLSITQGVGDAHARPAAPLAIQPPPPPDAFYNLPTGWAAKNPGAVLKSRPVKLKALQLLPLNVQAWQLLYRTTGADGQPYAAVTTVMIPRGPARPRPLLSYQMATDSVLRICNPSYGLTHGFPVELNNPAGPLPFPLPAGEVALAAAGLEQGWAVAIPDHGGVDNRFLTPRQPGYAVLDGIRAVEGFAPVGLAGAETPVGLWGYSGGGIATSITAEEQRSYAPELNIAGAALGAPVRGDILGTLNAVNATPAGGLIPIALGAVLKDRPDLSALIDKYGKPGARRLIAETQKHCLVQNALTNLWFDYRRYLKAPLSTILNEPLVKPEIDARGLTGKAPAAPIYLYNATSEEVSTIAGADKMARSYCAGGTAITYRRETFPPRPIPLLMSTHAVNAITGAPNAFAWLKSRLAADSIRPTGCDIKTVPATIIDPPALATLGPSFIGNTLLAALGRPIGK